MIDSVSISPVPVPSPKLRVVRGISRIRSHIHRKRKYLALKRVSDILFSVIIITCVLSWLTPLLAILIKLNSPGPVFFVQQRIGFGGRSFRCYKFRTMVVNSEADTMQATENDRRITRLGKLLRISNVDELPQFLNILRGEMSVIGPRPHMYADCTKFAAAIPGYKFRNLVRPGLTGLAQIKGYHGPALTQQSMIMRFFLDKQYIEQIGFGADLKILFHTLASRFLPFVKILSHKQPAPPITKTAGYAD